MRTVRKKNRLGFAAGLLLACLFLISCGRGETSVSAEGISSSLTYRDSLELTCATEFSVDYYEEGFSLVTIHDTDRYLVVPEGAAVPDDLPDGVAVLQQPLTDLYLAASAVMDMFVSLDALDRVLFSAQQADGWYIEEAREAMEAGEIRYAGKYSAPDYEQILAAGCPLAIENTMIYHCPEVKEELENFGVTVLVDYSSYEAEPLGRTEWVRLYGLLLDQEEEAKEAFEAQIAAFSDLGEEESGKSVAFFYITSSGEVSVRRSSDYLAKMIEMAGGRYIFDGLGEEDESATSTMNLQMEEFYADAKDADILIYNSSIDGELNSVAELLAKSELLANFQAVQEGEVYCTGKNLYQSSMELGEIIADLHHVFAGEDEALTYIYKLS